MGSLNSSCLRMRLVASEIADFDFVLYSGIELVFSGSAAVKGACVVCWLDSCRLHVIWIVMGWSLCSTLRLHSRVTPTRPLTLTMYCIRAGIVEEFTFAVGECDCWLVSTSTVAVADAGG